MGRYAWESEKGYTRRKMEEAVEEGKKTRKEAEKHTEHMKRDKSSSSSSEPVNSGPDYISIVLHYILTIPYKLFIWSVKAVRYSYHGTLAINSMQLKPTSRTFLYPLYGLFVLSFILYSTAILTNYLELWMFLIPLISTLGMMAIVSYNKMKPIDHIKLPALLKLTFSYLPLILVSYIPAFLGAYYIIQGIVALISSLYS